jgi:mycothiol synthase
MSTADERDPIPYPPGTRRFEPGDEAAILAISTASLEAGEFEGVTRRDLEESVKRLAGDPAMCAVAIDEGEIVGYVVPRLDDLSVARAARRRGHATRLLTPARAIARRQGLAALELWVPADELAPGHRFAVARGFHYHSSMWLLRLSGDRAAPPATFADDVTVRWFEPGPDDEPYVDLVNAAFEDHPSQIHVSLDEIHHVHGLDGFDPTTILVATDRPGTGRLVGFIRIDRYDEDGRRIGDIRMIGVRPEGRGRGLGRELLRWGITELRARGAVDIELNVEGANDRALDLYRRAGFEPIVEWPHWTLSLDG